MVLVGLASCTSFDDPTTENYGAAPGIDINITPGAQTDSAFTVTITPQAGALYYAYIIDQNDEAEHLDSATLYKGGYGNTVVKVADQPTTTITIDNATPNTTYQVYAVAGSDKGIVGNVVVKSITTTDKFSPRPQSVATDPDNAAVQLKFSEAIKRGEGAVTAKYYKEWDLLDENMNVKSVDVPAEDITDGDITAAITAKTEGVGKIGNITINLATGDYTVSASIVPSASFVINGNGATIDASGLDDAFIRMNKQPGVDVVASGQYVITTESKIDNVKITGLTKSLFKDNGTPYAFKTFTISNSVFQYATQGNVVLNFAAAMAINFNITGSTFYSTTAGEANFIALSGKRPWQITGYEEVEGKLTVDHNTFYNVAKAKQFLNTNTLRGQNKYKYEMNSNIFVDVSNKKIYGNMTNNMNQVTTDGKNTYMWNGEFFAETNYNGDEGLQTDPGFKDAENGDFTLTATSYQYLNKTGDPRWIAYTVTIAEGIVNGTVVPDKTTAAEGDEITLTITPAEGYELDAITVTGVTSDIAVIVTDGKFTMPADAVSVNATFKEATPTGISSIENGQLTIDNDAPAYNLAGQKVGKGYKGIVIKNGKKVVMK